MDTRLLRQETNLVLRMKQRFPRVPIRIARIITIGRLTAVAVNCIGMHAGGDYVANIAAAYVRHNLTEYDTLFAKGYSKQEARAIVAPVVARHLQEWEE